MKLWLFHPKYLDNKGLLGLWNEALLAQTVLIALVNEQKIGYSRHPELEKMKREKARNSWLESVGIYLSVIYQEGIARGFRFDRGKIKTPEGEKGNIRITETELKEEEEIIKGRLSKRSPNFYSLIKDEKFEPHPVFVVED